MKILLIEKINLSSIAIDHFIVFNFSTSICTLHVLQSYFYNCYCYTFSSKALDGSSVAVIPTWTESTYVDPLDRTPGDDPHYKPSPYCSRTRETKPPKQGGKAIWQKILQIKSIETIDVTTPCHRRHS